MSNNQTTKQVNKNITKNSTWIASFDIGSKNFCFYVEECDTNLLKNIKNIPSIQRYNPNGTPTDKMNDILNTIFKDGKTVIHENVDLTTNCSKGKYLDQNVLHNMTNMLDSYYDIWDKCSIIVVEQQMSFRGKINTSALKIGQHCQSYFLFRYGKFKTIIEYPSYHKTHILGAEKINKGITKAGKIKYVNIDKPARKKWSVEKAKEILTIRGEIEHILFSGKVKRSKKDDKSIKSKSIKKDDLADTLTQLASFKYLYFVDS